MAAPMSMVDFAIEDEDDDFLYLLLSNEPIPKRITFNPEWPRFDLLTPNDNQCLDKFRFLKDDIYRLRELLRLPEKLTLRNKSTCSGLDALKFQSVVIPNGLIAHLYGPVEGRRHDSALLRMSGLMREFEARNLTDRNGLPYAIYGDPAYPIRRYLIGPFKGADLTHEEQEFNSRMSSVRECVEWEFGKMIKLFAFLDFRKNLKVLLSPVAKYYLVGGLLTNCHTCL
ncbi:uncharacterized protein LOC117293721 [Asterias rubens]|uniref:uncharacterized protein LOC117293721 n=1 Tax=Asterias rubens TaxID=7604 RepID=UPI001455A5CA|nr:uncharacterized protein LOC117293721 [Asterias rubens]